MSSALIALLLISSCLFVVTAFAQAPNVMMARPTVTSVTASVLFEQPMESYVVYGKKRTTYTDSTSVAQHKAGVPENVLIGRCIPDARYYYRVRYRKSGSVAFSSTDEYTFQTQRAPGSSFRFLIEADEHLYDKKGIRSMYQVTLANQAKDSADFLLSLGDIFGDDHTPATTTSADMQELHKDYRQYLGGVCTSMPFFVCLGNHEGEMGYYLKQTPPDNIAVYGTLWRKYYYPNPVPDGFYTGNTAKEAFGVDLPENYYAWTWGDALFVVLDVYRHCDINEKPQNWDWTLGEAQYQWFRETLSKSTAKYKFVFAHHVRGQGRGAIDMAKGFEWGGYDNGGRWQFAEKRPGWELAIHQLMVKYGVNVFFQGHDHLFAKEELDGVVYHEVPMPSDSTYEIGVLANADAYKGVTMRGSGHIRVDVRPDGDCKHPPPNADKGHQIQY
ncbi:MAG: metallophosphoesterase family protein [Candidatus Kapaibacterium sp.]